MLILLQQVQISVIAAGSEENVAAGRQVEHLLQHGLTLMICLILAVTNIDKGKEAVGAAEARCELLEIGTGAKDATGGESLGQAVHIGIKENHQVPIVNTGIGMNLMKVELDLSP